MTGSHTLHCGDCLAILPTLASRSVDLVITSPPYNLDLNYGLYQDKLPEAAYLNWMMAIATELRRVLRPDGAFFLNIAGSSSAPWLPFELIVRLRSLFMLQNHISWVKSIALPDDSRGHFKPVPGQRFLHRNHEHIFHLTLDGVNKLDRLAVGVPFKDKSNIRRRNHSQDLRCRGDTWFIPYETIRSKSQKFHHPGTFPLDLPRWCIKLHGKPRPVVLDPFAGTGTSLIAAIEAGGKAIGVEIDPNYCKTAEDRIAGQYATRRDQVTA